MSSPTDALKNLLEAALQKKITLEDFLGRLSEYENFLVGYWERFENLPFPDKLSQRSQEIEQKVAASFGKLEEALGVAREWAESQDPALLATFNQLIASANTGLLDALDESAEQALNNASG